jgi:hypothetical protein
MKDMKQGISIGCSVRQENSFRAKNKAVIPGVGHTFSMTTMWNAEEGQYECWH